MPPVEEQVVVRQHERYSCRLAAATRVAQDLEGAVPLARGVREGSDGAGIACTIVDVSRGGIGIETGVFLPKTCKVEVTLPGSSIGDASARVALRGTVMRIAMLDRTPRYYLGLSFNPSDMTTTKIAEALLANVKARQTAPAPAPSATTGGRA